MAFFKLLQENGDALLQENGDYILLEPAGLDTGTSLTVATSANRVEAWARSVAPGLTAALSIARSRNRLYSIGVTLNTYQTIINRIAISITTSCGAVASTSASLARTFIRSVASSATIATAISESSGWAKTLAANLNLTAAISKGVAFTRVTASALKGMSSFSLVWSGVSGTLITIATGLTTTSSIAYQWAARRTVSPSLTLTVAISRVVAGTRNISMSVALAVSFLINEAVGRALKITATVSHYFDMVSVASHAKKIIKRVTQGGQNAIF